MAETMWPGHTNAEYYRCCCGHAPRYHWFPTGDEPGGVSGLFAHGPLPGHCIVKKCECDGYDHITGKPDHPLQAEKVAA